MPRPGQIEAPPEIEHDQAKRKLGEHARLGEGGFAQPAEDARAEEKARRNVAGNGRQDARRGREAAASKSCQQQQPEDQEAIGGRRPRGQEIGGSQSVLMRATVVAAS